MQNCISIREYAAVCWGGLNGTEYSKYWSILQRNRKRSGEPHLPGTCFQIPSLTGRTGHRVTAVNYDLIVCGGKISGTETSSCFILNTNEDNPGWYSMASMPINRNNFGFVTFGDAAFAIGGISTTSSWISQVDRWTKSKGWETMASYPIAVTGLCAVADHGYDQIFGIGGKFGKMSSHVTNQVYAYSVSKNQWSSMPKLLDSRFNIGCNIIRRRTTGNRMITVIGGGSNTIQYLDLTAFETNSLVTWVRGPTAAYDSMDTRIVSLTPYESVEVIKC